MLAIRLLVSPCRARCSPRSVGRSTFTVPSSRTTFISRLTTWSSSPFGPLTLTEPGWTSTSTPSGISIGFLPIRLISGTSPDVRHDLTADAALAGLVACHHASGGGHDRGAHAAEHPWDVLSGHVAAPTGPRDPLHAADHRAAVLRVAKLHLDHLADPPGLHAEVGDVALLLEDAGHLALEPRGRDLDLLVLREQRVADPVQVVGDWIGQHLIITVSSPARLGHPRHVAVVGGIAQADPAEAELAVIRARPSALAAAVVPARLELRGPSLPDPLRCLRHQLCSLSGGCSASPPLPPDSPLGA